MMAGDLTFPRAVPLLTTQAVQRALRFGLKTAAIFAGGLGMKYLLSRNVAAELPWIVRAYDTNVFTARIVCAFASERDALAYIVQQRKLALASVQS